MTDFSATDAAIEGFRIARRKPVAILIWSLAQFLVTVALGATAALVIGPDMQKLAAPDTAVVMADPAARAQLLSTFLRFGLVFLPFGVIWGAVQSCAVYRVLLRPADSGLGYLKLGGDELRMIGLWLLYVLLWVGAYILFIVSVVVLALVGALIAGLGGGKPDASMVFVITTIALLVPFLAMVWVLVRLSLSGPMTFAERRIRLWASWKLTRRHFWGLAGAYLVSLILAWVVNIAGLCLALVVAFAVTHQGLGGIYQEAFHPDYSSLAAFFSPSRLVVLAVQSLFLGLFAAVIYAPAAEAYRMLAAPAAPATPTTTDEPAAPRGPWG
jgi:hypothetical protein